MDDEMERAHRRDYEQLNERRTLRIAIHDFMATSACDDHLREILEEAIHAIEIRDSRTVGRWN